MTSLTLPAIQEFLVHTNPGDEFAHSGELEVADTALSETALKQRFSATMHLGGLAQAAVAANIQRQGFDSNPYRTPFATEAISVADGIFLAYRRDVQNPNSVVHVDETTHILLAGEEPDSMRPYALIEYESQTPISLQKIVYARPDIVHRLGGRAVVDPETSQLIEVSSAQLRN